MEETAKKTTMTAKWYIVHTHSGSEKKVAQQVLEKVTQKEMQEQILDVQVPTESVVEVRKGRKVNADRNFFPGYIMVKMEMNDDSWHLVKSIPKVTGFLGADNKPQPISEKEAESIFKQVEEGIESPKHSVVYDIGESVKVIDGPFDSFVGVVEEIDDEKNKLKVAVSIFGRSTPVELEYTQVEKV